MFQSRFKINSAINAIEQLERVLALPEEKQSEEFAFEFYAAVYSVQDAIEHIKKLLKASCDDEVECIIFDHIFKGE